MEVRIESVVGCGGCRWEEEEEDRVAGVGV
jgi:hypothetical protein